jgi:hypothetical protein
MPGTYSIDITSTLESGLISVGAGPDNARAQSIEEIGMRYASGESASRIAAEFADPLFSNIEYVRRTGIEYAKNNGLIRTRFDYRAYGSNEEVNSQLSTWFRSGGYDSVYRHAEKEWGTKISKRTIDRRLFSENVA